MYDARLVEHTFNGRTRRCNVVTDLGLSGPVRLPDEQQVGTGQAVQHARIAQCKEHPEIRVPPIKPSRRICLRVSPDVTVAVTRPASALAALPNAWLTNYGYIGARL